jgi:hypothetical protein
MSPGSPDDKSVGDATMARIDELAGGWTVPRRAPRERQDPSPAPDLRASAPAEPRGLAKSTPSPAAEKVRSRGTFKKKSMSPSPREKTKARGKERGKTTSRRPPLDPPIPFLGVARGTEQPPVGPGPAARADGDDPDASAVLDRATTRAVDRSTSEVLDRATTRALDRSPSEILDRAPTRAVDRSETDALDRAPTRAVDRSETDPLDRAATRVIDRSEADALERAATRALTDHVDPELLDHAATTIFKDKDRSGVELVPEPATPSSASEPSAPPSDPASLVESRNDETVLQAPGSEVYAASVEARKAGAPAVLRVPPTLPRRRGVFGDLLYIYTAMVGTGRARREMASAARKLDSERQARLRRLADLARLALADSALSSDILTAGREEIIDLEDQRSRVDGAAAAAEAEIASLERDREEEKKRHARELDELRRSGTDIDEKLEPLQRRLRTALRRVARLQENMACLDSKLTKAESRLAKLSAEKKAEAEATIATMRAERRGLDKEEPELAAEIDQLEPAIASLTASRAEGRARAARIEEQERAAVLRVAEKVVAVKARCVVDERAEEELALAQEEALRALGERLAVERSPEIVPRLRGIEEHEVAIGTLERRHLELTELLHGVDRWTVARGVLWLLVIAVAVAAALVWSVALGML